MLKQGRKNIHSGFTQLLAQAEACSHTEGNAAGHCDLPQSRNMHRTSLIRNSDGRGRDSSCLEEGCGCFCVKLWENSIHSFVEKKKDLLRQWLQERWPPCCVEVLAEQAPTRISSAQSELVQGTPMLRGGLFAAKDMAAETVSNPWRRHWPFIVQT